MGTPGLPQFSLRQRFLGGAAWTGSSRIVTNFLGIFVTVILARLLQPSDFGLLAMATVFSGLINQTQFFGVGAALIQRDEVTPSIQRAAFTIALGSSLAIYLALFVSADAIGWIYKDARVVPIVRVIALTFPIDAFSVVPRAMLRRNLTLRGEAMTSVVVMVVDSTLTIFLAWAGMGVWALVLGKLAGTVVTSIGLSLVCPWPARIGLRGGDARTLLRFGTVVTVSNYMWYGYSNFDLLIVGRVLGSSVLGIYSMALNLAKMPIERVYVAVTPLLLPLFSRAKSNPQELGRVLCRVTRYNALLLFPLGAGLGAVADDAVVVLLGQKWAGAIIPLRLLCFYVLARCVLALIPPALLALGQLRRLLWFHAACLFLLPAAFVVGLRWGPTGVACAWALGYPLVSVLLLLPPTLRAMDLPWAAYRRALGSATFASAMMVLTVVLAGFLPIPGPARLALRIVIGAAVYAGCVTALEGSMFHEFRQMLQDARKGIQA